MAILTFKTNTVSNAEEINKLIEPNYLFHHKLSPELKTLVDQKLDHIDRNELYALLPSAALQQARERDLIPTIVAKIEEPISEHLQTRLNKSKTPHINHGNELHVFLLGGGLFELFLKHGTYTLEVCPGDVLFIEKSTKHSFALTAENKLMLASFHQDEFEVFHKRVEYFGE